jgi:1-aminocyclopropane-1-carboxylate deaminase
MDLFNIPSPLHQLHHHPGISMGIKLYLKRDDLIHQHVSGNKWRKLKYNIEEARKQNAETLVTAGGPWSNHLSATATAGKLLGFKTKAFIRGVEPKIWSDTLLFCKSNGMSFTFLTKTEFDGEDLLAGIQPEEYFIPLGGENELGIKGCSEIIDEIEIDFDIFCSPIGTGTTLRGIGDKIPDKKVIGFSALKAQQHSASFMEWVHLKHNVFIEYDRFGGFAKVNPTLKDFIVDFQMNNNITLDPVYTGKMMFELYGLIEKRQIDEGSIVIALHTGGLQGIKGFPDLHRRLFTS